MAKTGIMSLEPTRIKKAIQLPQEEKSEQNTVSETGNKGATKPKVKHHTLFVYPLHAKPNPALSPFFAKLSEVKEKINSDKQSSGPDANDKALV